MAVVDDYTTATFHRRRYRVGPSDTTVRSNTRNNAYRQKGKKPFKEARPMRGFKDLTDVEVGLTKALLELGLPSPVIADILSTYPMVIHRISHGQHGLAIPPMELWCRSRDGGLHRRVQGEDFLLDNLDKWADDTLAVYDGQLAHKNKRSNQ